MLPLILFLIWAASSLVCAGWLFADLCEIWAPAVSPNERRNLRFSILMGIILGVFGPAGIVLMYLILWGPTSRVKRGWRLTLTPTK